MALRSDSRCCTSRSRVRGSRDVKRKDPWLAASAVDRTWKLLWTTWLDRAIGRAPEFLGVLFCAVEKLNSTKSPPVLAARSHP